MLDFNVYAYGQRRERGVSCLHSRMVPSRAYYRTVQLRTPTNEAGIYRMRGYIVGTVERRLLYIIKTTIPYRRKYNEIRSKS